MPPDRPRPGTREVPQGELDHSLVYQGLTGVWRSGVFDLSIPWATKYKNSHVGAPTCPYGLKSFNCFVFCVLIYQIMFQNLTRELSDLQGNPLLIPVKVLRFGFGLTGNDKLAILMTSLCAASRCRTSKKILFTLFFMTVVGFLNFWCFQSHSWYFVLGGPSALLASGTRGRVGRLCAK